jgi:hypothetical protein
MYLMLSSHCIIEMTGMDIFLWRHSQPHESWGNVHLYCMAMIANMQRLLCIAWKRPKTQYIFHCSCLTPLSQEHGFNSPIPNLGTQSPLKQPKHHKKRKMRTHMTLYPILHNLPNHLLTNPGTTMILLWSSTLWLLS